MIRWLEPDSVFQSSIFIFNPNKRMLRHLVLPSLLIAAGSGIFVSCQKSESGSVHPGKEEGPLTEIASIEKETGKKLFSTDLVLKDSSGLNEVVLRVASSSKVLLDQYLSTYNLSIRPLSGEQKSREKAEALRTPVQSDQSRQFSSTESKLNVIVTEPVSVHLQDKVAGYALKVNVKPAVLAELAKGGRVAADTIETHHVSNNWPSSFSLTTTTRYEGMYKRNGVRMARENKDKWYTSWYRVFYESPSGSGIIREWETFSVDPQPLDSPGIAAWNFYVDGPYRVKAKVRYVPYFAGSTEETGYWITFY